MVTVTERYVAMALKTIYEVISTQSAMLVLVLLLPLCQCELFKVSLDSLGYLEDNSTFQAQSRIECGALCLLRTDRHRCTVFILDNSTKTCTCGRKSFATMDVNGAFTTAYVLTDCQIEVQITGISFFPVWQLFLVKPSLPSFWLTSVGRLLPFCFTAFLWLCGSTLKKMGLGTLVYCCTSVWWIWSKIKRHHLCKWKIFKLKKIYLTGHNKVSLHVLP